MKILVVVDMQNDFITGSLGTPEAQAIVPNVKKKIEESVANGDIIIYTRDAHFTNYLETMEGKKLPVEHCIIGTDGWRISDELRAPATYKKEVIVDKLTFGSTDLPNVIRRAIDDELRNDLTVDIREIELVGLCSDICVISNALILKAEFFNLYDISVDASCCAGVTPKSHEAALKTMEMCQINVKRG